MKTEDFKRFKRLAGVVVIACIALGLAAAWSHGIPGIGEGRDYRGEPVLAYVCPLPNTAWAMVARQDVKARFAVWSLPCRILVASLMVCVLATGAAALHRYRVRQFQTLYRTERQLRDNLEQYHVTLKAIGDAVIATDCDGFVTFMNPVAEALTGWSDQDARGKPLDTVFHIVNEETRQPVESPVTKALREGDIVGLANHTILLSRNGAECPIADSAAPIRDKEGRVLGVVLVFRDQTLEQNYKTLFQKMLSAFASHEIICDAAGKPVNYRFLDVNPAFEKMTGLHARDIIGKTVLDVLPGTEPVWIERYGHVALSGEPLQFENYSQTLGRHFSVSAFRLKNNQFAVIFKDVTDLKEAEAQLLKQNEALAHAVAINARFAAAIEQSRDAIVITDANAAILYVNKTFEDITGYAREAVIGQNPRILQSGRHDRAFYRNMWRTLLRGEAATVRFFNKRKDGTFYTEDATISPVRDADGTIVNYVAVKRDVTRQIETEARYAQTQKLESVGRLAGGVAHDFNNMLGVILGNAELLRDHLSADTPGMEEVDAIIQAADRSARVTRQLLSFARKQAGTPQRVELNQAVGDCLKLLRQLIGENIELVWMPHHAPCPVLIDPVQLDQVLTNLCVNARDAVATHGTITLSTRPVRIAPEDCVADSACHPGDCFELRVNDTGSGIAPDVLPHIFEPFFSTKPIGEGSGLGLAMIHGIITQNDGFIRVESTPGNGTTFKIFLPALPEAEAGSGQTPTGTIPHGHGETILVVEDEDMLLRLSGSLLTSLEYHVLAAPTADVALKYAADPDQTIDLLLTDVIMPDMNGHELAKHVRSLRPEIPVLFMSGYTADKVSERDDPARHTGFIAKPFGRREIAIHVHQALQPVRS